MRSLLVCLLFTACGPEYAVVPRSGAALAQATQNGVTLTAFANQWAADPDDLADYVTPIAVDLYNGTASEVRISYADFALRDETGFRYNAINPFEAASTVGERLVPPDSTGVLLAARGHGFSGGFRGGGRVFVPTPRGHGGAWYGARSWGHGGRAWIGFHVHPGFRYYYGPGVMYWGAPWVYPPWYWGMVYHWGPPYYPYRPSHDVLEYALPEGVIAPGGHVNGFLYFQNATSRGARSLDLSWDVRDNRSNQVLATTHVPLAVVHRD